MRLQKILCPLDFSAGSQHALDHAVRIATLTQAELVFAHVVHIPPLATQAEYPVPHSITDQVVDEGNQALAAAARAATADGAPRVSTLSLSGAPWDRIVAVLRDDPRFDLAVMGTHGRTGLARVLLGSVAEKVVRHAPCPVLVARGGAGPVQRVLCPVDFSRSSRGAVDFAARLVEPTGSLTLLHVIELPVTYDAHTTSSEFLRELDVRSTRMLDELAAATRDTHRIATTTAIRVGSAGAQTLAALDHEKFDLVAIGSHGRTGLGRALLGSVAEKILRHAPCSVVVTHARG